jgi:hypothetical protein
VWWGPGRLVPRTRVLRAGLLIGGALAIRIGCHAGPASTARSWGLLVGWGGSGSGVGTLVAGVGAGGSTLLGPEGTGTVSCLGFFRAPRMSGLVGRGCGVLRADPVVIPRRVLFCGSFPGCVRFVPWGGVWGGGWWSGGGVGWCRPCFENCIVNASIFIFLLCSSF